MTSKPTILLVHGAWHRPAHYAPITDALARAGLAALAPELPSTGADRAAVAGKTPADDEAAVRAALAPALAGGRDVVVVAHSYGTIPATLASAGCTAAERAGRGLRGGVCALVYLAAFALPLARTSLVRAQGGRHAPFVRREDDVLELTDLVRPMMYGDIDEAVADEAVRACVLQSTASCETALERSVDDIPVPKTYVVGELDDLVPRDMMLGLAEAAGAKVVKVRGGHMAFLRADGLEGVVKAILEAAAS